MVCVIGITPSTGGTGRKYKKFSAAAAAAPIAPPLAIFFSIHLKIGSSRCGLIVGYGVCTGGCGVMVYWTGIRNPAGGVSLVEGSASPLDPVVL
jgi:hypothetical protein